MPDVVVFVEVPSGSRKKTETRGFGDRVEAERIIAAAVERATL
jgi:hypothetical protein